MYPDKILMVSLGFNGYLIIVLPEIPRDFTTRWADLIRKECN